MKPGQRNSGSTGGKTPVLLRRTSDRPTVQREILSNAIPLVLCPKPPITAMTIAIAPAMTTNTPAGPNPFNDITSLLIPFGNCTMLSININLSINQNPPPNSHRTHGRTSAPTALKCHINRVSSAHVAPSYAKLPSAKAQVGPRRVQFADREDQVKYFDPDKPLLQSEELGESAATKQPDMKHLNPNEQLQLKKLTEWVTTASPDLLRRLLNVKPNYPENREYVTYDISQNTDRDGKVLKFIYLDGSPYDVFENKDLDQLRLTVLSHAFRQMTEFHQP